MKDIKGDMGTVLKTGKISAGEKNVLSALLMKLGVGNIAPHWKMT